MTRLAAGAAENTHINQDNRLQELCAWLEPRLVELIGRRGWGGVTPSKLIRARREPRFRPYCRWEAEGRSLVVMDAPPPQENCRPFVEMAGLLAEAGLHVPEILAEDLERGFLLLRDLGRQTYLDVIDEGNADMLFDDAIRALLDL